MNRKSDVLLYRFLSTFAGVCVLVMLCCILWPLTSGGSRRSGKAQACLSNLKQIGNAITMYATEWNDVLPIKEHWMDLASPYLHNVAVYRCPGLSFPGFGYSYNPMLSSESKAKFEGPDLTPLTYDSTNTTKNAFSDLSSLPSGPRHDQSNSMGFLDGHVKKVAQDVLGSLKNAPGQVRE